MFELFFSILIASLLIYGHGLIFNRIILKNQTLISNFFETSIIGIIFLSFNALLINFFIPINKVIGTVLLIISLIFFFNELVKNAYRINILKKILIISVISFILIAYSNVYRPDAGLYHLPYVSVLNENKIVFGLSNIHSRFGHISIIQYLSAIFNNYLIPIESISIPSSLIFSFFSYFLFSSLRKFIKKKNIHDSLIFFITLIISIYSYNRFSEYGNDTPGHIFFLILFIFLFSKNMNEKNFSIIILISTFLFLIKPFMLILIFLIFYLFLNQKNKIEILKNRKIIFSIFFLSLWLIKNVIISGCIIYPISNLCFKNLIITDTNSILHQEISGEAWSKDWSNYEDKVYNMEEYNKNFRWIKNWYNNHFRVVIEKLIPIIIFLLIIYFLFSYNKNSIIKKKLAFENYAYFFLFSLFIIVWFLKFPIYRYGSSFLIAFLINCIILLTRNFNFSSGKTVKIIAFFNIFLIIALFAFIGKNSARIFSNKNIKSAFPNIYDLSNVNKTNSTTFKKIYLNDGGYYFFSNGKNCMYEKSPCTSYSLKNINYKEFYKYKVFYKK